MDLQRQGGTETTDESQKREGRTNDKVGEDGEEEYDQPDGPHTAFTVVESTGERGTDRDVPAFGCKNIYLFFLNIKKNPTF